MRVCIAIFRFLKIVYMYTFTLSCLLNGIFFLPAKRAVRLKLPNYENQLILIM